MTDVIEILSDFGSIVTYTPNIGLSRNFLPNFQAQMINVNYYSTTSLFLQFIKNYIFFKANRYDVSYVSSINSVELYLRSNILVNYTYVIILVDFLSNWLNYLKTFPLSLP